MKTKYKKALTITAYIVTGILIGWLLIPGRTGTPDQTKHVHEQNDEKETIWTCSMHPQIRQHESGLCPICGMELVPLNKLAHDDEDYFPSDVQMTESDVKMANLATLVVTKGHPEKNIHLQGKIQADERKIASLTARYNGRIESLSVNYTGQKVFIGQSLGKVYSPDLINAQKELLEAVKYKDDNPSFYQSAISKLKSWSLTDQQIKEIEKNGDPILYFDIISPISGTVSEMNVSVGDYINEGKLLFKIIDLSSVWVMLDAYESDLPWINTGDLVTYTVQSSPGITFKGKVSFIDPFIDPTTRVAKIRVEASNMDGIFKPEMFVNGIIESKAATITNDIMIPKSAVLWTGKRSIVYRKVPDTKNPVFRYTQITLGPEAGNYYIVKNGLKEGDEIAVNGVFSIDAAAQLAGIPSMMNPEGGKVKNMHHSDMEMSENTNMDQKNNNQNATDEHNVPEEFKEQLMLIVNVYYDLKNGFVKSNRKKVIELANKLKNKLNVVDMNLLHGELHTKWMNYLKKITEGIDQINNSNDIEKQRTGFEIVSDQLILILENFNIHGKNDVYIDFCPMAFDNKGAYWLSPEKEIRNPYFGDKMLTCGEVKKTIKSK